MKGSFFYSIKINHLIKRKQQTGKLFSIASSASLFPCPGAGSDKTTPINASGMMRRQQLIDWRQIELFKMTKSHFKSVAHALKIAYP